jgi:hypothetical protein
MCEKTLQKIVWKKNFEFSEIEKATKTSAVKHGDKWLLQ